VRRLQKRVVVEVAPKAHKEIGLFSSLVQVGVYRDPVDPRAKGTVASEGIQIRVHLDEHFLGEIFRIVMVTRQLIGKFVYASLMAFYHFTEAQLDVCVRRLDHGDFVWLNRSCQLRKICCVSG
jgi:hypothetical protein